MSDRYAKMKAAFEKWQAQKGVAAIYEGDGKYKHTVTNLEWNDWQDAWQVATEAAKATGTAGESMSKAEIDAIVYKCRQNGNDTTYDIVNACLAARQPAPVSVSERDMMIAQAVRQACVNSYSPDDSASDYTEKMGDIDLATVIRAATNRSHP